ncbi:GSCFA domain-containing protein [Chitinophagaceae bacterium IBVUCB2]|nr:GSCFA domain-containing protein [Chitinophagaceae bacterium IBVUCB2]
MDLMVNIDIKKLPEPISYKSNILLIGSCFTEHIGNALQELKYPVLQNPNGILFGPDSVCKSLLSYIQNEQYTAADLFQLNEVWNSWQHHSRFSNIIAEDAVKIINQSQQNAHQFLKEADWLIITLGSSYTYQLTHIANFANETLGNTVANCHRAPANWFDKEMLETDDIKTMLEDCLKQLKTFNPKLKFLFTISPVRHIRDGVVENNRSKARLIESVHYIVSKFESAFYFPAYELVIDVLRDYRFYDIDLVHPNYPATEFVLDKFAEFCIDDDSRQLMQEIKKLVIARKHKAFQPATKAHQQFLVSHFEKTKELQEKYSFLNLKEELGYFSQT